MRFIVFGAGAVGGVIGGRLAQHGHDVVLIGRRDQYDAVRQHGLTLECPDSTATVSVEIVESPRHLHWTSDDVVFLTMKTQDTLAALQDLAALAPPDLPIVCVQNAVENERLAQRWFERVYGICVMCPTEFLVPGVVRAWSSPATGILDIGRYPSGTDEVTEAIASILRTSTFHSEPRADIMRWKYGKLLMNLGNAAEALCGPSVRSSQIIAIARQEGIACLRAAGINYVGDDEEKERRGNLLQLGIVAGQRRLGGSSWQSLHRRTGTIEADYLNGEIVLLGRLFGVRTPVNALLQRLANGIARSRQSPGSMTTKDLISFLEKQDISAS
jgi:2-dehydropantoate 2-reductase